MNERNPGSGAAPADHPSADSAAVSGAPRLLLRLEGAAALAAGSIGFARLDGNWIFFAAMFLVPDLSMLGYLAGRRVGAMLYNLGHSYISAALLAGVGAALAAHELWALALIWVAHIGFDRMLGYGLKYPTGFGDTHLGRVGRRGDA